MESLPRRMSVSSAVDWLCSRYGGDRARRLARLEQQKARRARSRKRFTFWAAVAAQLEAGSRAATVPCGDPDGAGDGRRPAVEIMI